MSEPAAETVRHAMNPTRAEIRAFPLSSHSDMVATLLAGKGRSVLDIGCGNGKFTWLLAKHFATVAAIDPNPRRIAEAQAKAKADGVEIDFREAMAETLPFADATFDVVVFSNSLHHIPGMQAALAEAARVVKPGGLVYVMEPVPAGNYFDATRLVNDETEVRTEAYRSVFRAEADRLVPADERLYRARRAFTSFEEWRDDQIERDAHRAEAFKVHGAEVRRLFDTEADREDGRWVFDQVSRVNLLRKAG